MAKTSTEPPGTGGSQFFVVTADDAGLPPEYAVARQGRDGARRRRPDRQARRPRDGAADADCRDREGNGRRLEVIAGVVLAAGASTRYGSPKQRLFLPRVLDRARRRRPRRRRRRRSARTNSTSRCGSSAATTGAAAPARACAAASPRWRRRRRTRSSSSPTAPTSTRAPCAGSSTHRDDGDVVAATYDGVRGHPVSIARSAWARVPDEGGRALEATLVACDDLVPPGDVDVPEQPSIWQRKT